MRPPSVLCAATAMLVCLACAGGATPAPDPRSGTGPGPLAAAPYTGFDPLLARAPYVTDLSQTSAVVTWATTARIPGSLRYGPLGRCRARRIAVAAASLAQIQVSPAPASTYPVRDDYQASVRLTGLAPGGAYCYTVLASGRPLLPAARPTQRFRTLDRANPRARKSLTFDVVGDFGETADRGFASDPAANNPSSVNSNQAAIDRLIGASAARFVVAVGDIAYDHGDEDNYGDLHETGTSVGGPGRTEISNIFGPSYWPLTHGIPVFATTGNHGRNPTLLTTWPETGAAARSHGTYGMQQYPALDGVAAVTAPSSWYAFSSGNVRFYVLDASWSDTALGTAAGTACAHHPGSPNCKIYEIDADAHFEPTSPEYRWLERDLRAHRGGIKLAFFHFPLRSDNPTQESDVYLQQRLEPLLAQNGVDIVFNGHAHDYERNTRAGPGTVITYVTGGGGGVISAVGGKGCSAWDAYAVGWIYSSGKGTSCGAARAPTSDAEVYNFLRVTVAGDRVTVEPVDAAGQRFDVRSYTFRNR